MTAAIELDRVLRRFGRGADAVTAVDHVSLAIPEGAFFALLGPSGSGKTTCLRLIAGFERPESGAVRLFGRDVADLPPNRRPVNTVFQDYALFPHMTVRDNVAYGLMVRGIDRRARAEAAEAALALVKLAGYGDRRPADLSGGQRQRVALARALVLKPRALLLDEPLGALDQRLRESMQDELKALQREVGVTFVFVTHDQAEALSMADRIAVFDRGRVVQEGPPAEVYARPATRFVADFVGGSNVLSPEVSARLGGPRAWASLRPERVRLGAGPHAGRVTGARYLGAATRVTVDLGGVEIAALAPAGVDPPPPGTEVRLGWDPDAPHAMAEA